MTCGLCPETRRHPIQGLCKDRYTACTAPYWVTLCQTSAQVRKHFLVRYKIYIYHITFLLQYNASFTSSLVLVKHPRSCRCSHQGTPCVNRDHPKGNFIINDHPEIARAEGQIVPRAKWSRIMVSKRVFFLPELIIFLIRNHQVMHGIPPGDAERPLRHLWLRACSKKY